jgi:hypothetical protein
VLRRAFLACACVLLSSCASWFPPPVSDPSGILSRGDIREIRAVVAARSDIPKPINWIQVLRPRVVRVFTGAAYTEKIDFASMLLYKRGGTWSINDSTLAGHPDVTSQERTEIREAIRAVTSSPIKGCYRAANPNVILVLTKDDQGYQALKIKGKWHFKKSVIIIDGVAI